MRQVCYALASLLTKDKRFKHHFTKIKFLLIYETTNAYIYMGQIYIYLEEICIYNHPLVLDFGQLWCLNT